MDLREFRIDKVLTEMQEMILVQLPEDEPWPVDYFLDQAVVCSFLNCDILKFSFDIF